MASLLMDNGVPRRGLPAGRETFEARDSSSLGIDIAIPSIRLTKEESVAALMSHFASVTAVGAWYAGPAPAGGLLANIKYATGLPDKVSAASIRQSEDRAWLEVKRDGSLKNRVSDVRLTDLGREGIERLKSQNTEFAQRIETWQMAYLLNSVVTLRQEIEAERRELKDGSPHNFANLSAIRTAVKARREIKRLQKTQRGLLAEIDGKVRPGQA